MRAVKSATSRKRLRRTSEPCDAGWARNKRFCTATARVIATVSSSGSRASMRSSATIAWRASASRSAFSSRSKIGPDTTNSSSSR
jgi:hypothetical protein